jgi:hypothetical protein
VAGGWKMGFIDVEEKMKAGGGNRGWTLVA